MNLPDFLQFDPFNALRKAMGAEKLGDFAFNHASPRLTREELERLASAGIEIDIKEIRILPDGTLAYKDSRVLLYIRDIPNYRDKGVQNLSKYHITGCPTLRDMRERNRWSRYVVATREDGLFQVNLISGIGTVTKNVFPLSVCKNCLNQLRFDGYTHGLREADRTRIVNEFGIARFFER